MKPRNFNEIYEEIIQSGIVQELANLRNKNNIAFISFFGLIVIALIAFFYHISLSVILCLIIAVVIVFVYFVRISMAYKKSFKSKIIEKIVKHYDPSFTFLAYPGVTSEEYRRSKFDADYDKFYSEDMIEGRINGKYQFKMSQVHTQKEEYVTDDQGNRRVEYHTLFKGLYGFVNVEGTSIMTMDIQSNSFVNKYNKSRIEVDSAEFEKDYDIFATDKVRAMEIFTSDLIQEFNDFQDETNKNIRIKVYRNVLFFRLEVGDIFEAPMIKDATSYEYLLKNFQLIDYPITIITKILENAESTKL